MTDITVTRNADTSRYEIRSGGEIAGFAEVEQRHGSVRFTHTEVDPAYQGQGLAGKLAAFALADAAKSGDAIVPLCPYIAKYLETHEIEGAVIRWPRASTGSATEESDSESGDSDSDSGDADSGSGSGDSASDSE